MAKKSFWGAFTILAVVLITAASPVYTATIMQTVEAYQGIKIYYNDVELAGEKQPYIINDTTYVPLRMMMDNFGKNIFWDSANSRIDISDNPDSSVSKLNEQLNQKDAEIAALKERIKSLESGTGAQNNTGGLSAPSSLTTKVLGASQILLNWDLVSGAASYDVYRSTSSSDTYSKIAAASDNTFTDTGLTAGTTYYYKVQASNSTSTSSFSSTANATTDSNDSSSTLGVPTGLTAEASGPDQIFLSWNSLSGASSYYIYRSTSSSDNFIIVATTSKNSFNDTGITTGTKYYYKIKAYQSFYTGPFSSTVSATAEAVSTLKAPTNLDADSKGSSKIELTWDPVSGASSYYIYRGTSSGGYSKIDTTSETSYTSSGLMPSNTYYYKVKAVNSLCTSEYSSAASAKTSAG